MTDWPSTPLQINSSTRDHQMLQRHLVADRFLRVGITKNRVAKRNRLIAIHLHKEECRLLREVWWVVGWRVEVGQGLHLHLANHLCHHQQVQVPKDSPHLLCQWCPRISLSRKRSRKKLKIPLARQMTTLCSSNKHIIDSRPPQS